MTHFESTFSKYSFTIKAGISPSEVSLLFILFLYLGTVLDGKKYFGTTHNFVHKRRSSHTMTHPHRGTLAHTQTYMQWHTLAWHTPISFKKSENTASNFKLQHTAIVLFRILNPESWYRCCWYRFQLRIISIFILWLERSHPKCPVTVGPAYLSPQPERILAKPTWFVGLCAGTQA